MTIAYKILGQTNPIANTMTTTYTVPGNNSAVVSSVVICNQSSNSASFSLVVLPSGESIGSQHFINFKTPIPGNDSITVTIGLTMSANDSISANISSSNVSVGVFGSEIY